jgi:hypothetical protein
VATSDTSSAGPEPSLSEALAQIELLRAQLAAELDAKARLQESLQLRNAALDAASAHFLIIEATGEDRRVVYANRALAVDHGYANASEMIGQKVTFSAPLRNAKGETTHIVCIGADITARREAGRLAADLAHEINIPLQHVGDSVSFLRSAFEDLLNLLHGYRDALTDLKSSHTSAAAQLADLREQEIECDFDFLRVEVPRAFERTLTEAERAAGGRALRSLPGVTGLLSQIGYRCL